jgi:hypothetical protein
VSQYYFLVASLPSLSFDIMHAPEPEDFLESVREHTSASVYEAVKSARIDAPIDLVERPVLVNRWQRFERALRNALVKVRASSAAIDAAAYVRTDAAGGDETDQSGVSDIAKDAFAEESPLSTENVLGKARWRFLDDLETGHYFDADRLIVYYLKLQLLARRRQLNREDGERLYKEATDKIMTDYYEERGNV